MYKGKKIAVVMPVYNGGWKTKEIILKTPKIYDVFIAVDDGSSDESYKVLQSVKNIILLKHKENKGYGGAQKTLYREALKYNVDYAVLLHQDGQYSPNEIPLLLDKAIETGADIVLGSRVMSGKKAMLTGGVPKYKYYGNVFLTKLENIVFRTKISEFHTGFRAYSKNAMKSINFEELTDKYYFDSDVILEARRKKLKVAETPIGIYYHENLTYANPISYGFEIIYLILRYILKRH